MARSAPALLNEAARRYASALFGLALESGQLDTLEAELSGLAGWMHQHEGLGVALRSPVVSGAEKEAVLTDLCKLRNVSELLQRFLMVVARAGRAGDLPAFAEAFSARLAEHWGSISIVVRTAREPHAGEQSDIARSLSSILGDKTEIRYETDPGLLGGLQVCKGSQLIDVSLRGGLDRLCRSLKGI